MHAIPHVYALTASDAEAWGRLFFYIVTGLCALIGAMASAIATLRGRRRRRGHGLSAEAAAGTASGFLTRMWPAMAGLPVVAQRTKSPRSE